MSIAAELYQRDIFDPDIHGPKPRTHTLIPWGAIAEPIHYGYGNLEIMLAGVEVMLESSRTYHHPGQWGKYGVTGLLLDSSCVNMENRAWHVNGDFDALKNACRRVLTIGMLTGYHGAARWRKEKHIAMETKVRLQGPFGDDCQAQENAWKRLQSFNGRKIISLNKSHPAARQISFTGMSIGRQWRGKREWHLDYYVQYPREEFGSGWDLSHLCDPDPILTKKRRFDFKRGSKETLTQWFNRVVDFVESLLLPVKPKAKRKAR